MPWQVKEAEHLELFVMCSGGGSHARELEPVAEGERREHTERELTRHNHYFRSPSTSSTSHALTRKNLTFVSVNVRLCRCSRRTAVAARTRLSCQGPASPLYSQVGHWH